jgi:hypothetical protein
MPFKFDGSVFASAFIKLTAEEKIGEFLDNFGEDNLKKCIAEGKFVTDLIPDAYKLELKSKFPAQAKGMIDGITNQQVYGWFPKNWRETIQSCPNWQPWIRGQLDAIRCFLKS